MGRVKEAWRALRGRTDGQVRMATEVTRLRAEWTALMAEILDTLDKVDRAYGRLRKANERREKQLAPQQPVERPIAPADRKAAVRAKLRAKRMAEAGHAPETALHANSGEEP